MYAITPTTEEIATAVAMRRTHQPVHPWELRALTGGAEAESDDLIVEDDYDDDDDMEQVPF